MTTDFLGIVRQWFRDIRMLADTSRAYTRILVYAYNWATCPRTLRTDLEHHVCRAMARWLRARLQRRSGWHEMETGRLWA